MKISKIKHPCVVDIRKHIAGEFPGLQIEQYRYMPGSYLLRVRGASMEHVCKAGGALSVHGYVWRLFGTRGKHILVRPVFFDSNRTFREALKEAGKRHAKAVDKLREWYARHPGRDAPENILQPVIDASNALTGLISAEKEREERLTNG